MSEPVIEALGAALISHVETAESIRQKGFGYLLVDAEKSAEKLRDRLLELGWLIVPTEMVRDAMIGQLSDKVRGALEEMGFQRVTSDAPARPQSWQDLGITLKGHPSDS